MKELHEYAKLFPALEGEAFQSLCDDIQANGLLNPITLYKGKILDGQNRARACEKTGVRPVYDEYRGDGPLTYVISQNMQRRDLSSSQKAVLALEVLELRRRDSGIAPKQPRGPEAAKLHTSQVMIDVSKEFNIHSSTLAGALRIQKNHSKYLAPIREGKISIKDALHAIRSSQAAKIIKDIKVEAKKERLQDFDRWVKEYLDAIKVFIRATTRVRDGAERFSPEAVAFTARRHILLKETMAETERLLKSIKHEKAA